MLDRKFLDGSHQGIFFLGIAVPMGNELPNGVPFEIFDS